MQLLTDKYLQKYLNSLDNFTKNLEGFLVSAKEMDFEYLTESSSVFSSNIEGNSLDLNSFMNAKKIQKSKNKDVEEIENLIEAYKFAQSNELNLNNFLKTHEISAKTLLIKSKRGKLRQEPVGVFGSGGLIYMAIEHENLDLEMNKLFDDIKILLQKNISKKEVFYYASMIHLIFVHIHPFSDGNGRTARLLEKWFLSEKIGKDMWNISAEKYYWENRQEYYNNINLGVDYYELNYDSCLDFLYMLPNSLK